ncbi:hypothetical protein LL972_20440, partial [Xanthomonas campestris pv. asclepiadis]|nr:hypothetical protein [Xanthomonas campestris pv. asclepiadis]
MGNASSALSNAIRLGTIAEVNLVNARCRVQVGEMLTDYLPLSTPPNSMPAKTRGLRLMLITELGGR